eukprot:scaffold9181_cov37-Tisochrysis_lutea.AAC.3
MPFLLLYRRPSLCPRFAQEKHASKREQSNWVVLDTVCTQAPLPPKQSTDSSDDEDIGEDGDENMAVDTTGASGSSREVRHSSTPRDGAKVTLYGIPRPEVPETLCSHTGLSRRCRKSTRMGSKWCHAHVADVDDVEVHSAGHKLLYDSALLIRRRLADDRHARKVPRLSSHDQDSARGYARSTCQTYGLHWLMGCSLHRCIIALIETQRLGVRGHPIRRSIHFRGHRKSCNLRQSKCVASEAQ